MRIRSVVSTLAILILAAGCTASTGGSVTRSSPDMILREDIIAVNRSTAWEVVEMLRPIWLQQRSGQSVNNPTGITVFVNDVRYGDLQSMRSIPTADVHLIQRYSATAASQRWGPGHSAGVIFISTQAIQRQ